MHNILVAVDLKATDALLVQHAEALAEKFKSKVWIVHVAAPDPDFVGFKTGPTYIRTVRAHELRAEHHQLQALADQLQKKSIAAESLLIQGPTVELLIEEVGKLKIDLLVMGSHKHSLLYKLWIGHTSKKVIEKIPVPLLIVPLDNG